MTDDRVITLEEVRAQVAVREQEIVGADAQDVPPSLLEAARVTAREEALERLCDAMGYLQRSLEEVGALRARQSAEHAAIIRETIQAKGAAARLAREVEHEAQARARLEREVQALHAELGSVRLAQRAVDRQLQDPHGTDETAAAAPIPG